MTTATQSISAHPLAIRHAALVLWVDAFWDDEAERKFTQRTGWSAHELFGQQLMDRPTPQMPENYVAEIGHWMAQAEKEWGRTIPDVAEEMDYPIRDLACDIAMSIAGYGVGPEDRQGFPKELKRKIQYRRENPANGSIPDLRIADLVIENYHPRDYAAQWGDDKTNQMFYNFSNMFDAEESWYVDALLKIRQEITFAGDRSNKISKSKRAQNTRGLTRLFNNVKVGS